MPYTEEQREYNRLYRQMHKAELAAYARQYRAANLAEEQARGRAAAKLWAERNRGKNAVQCKQRRDSNLETARVREAAYAKTHREVRNRISANWDKQHPEARAAKASRRRSRQRSLNESFGENLRLRVKQQFQTKCFVCGAVRDLHIDHHLPLAAGHPLALGNAVLLCSRCNKSKGAKLPAAFYTPEQLRILNRLLAAQRSWGTT